MLGSITVIFGFEISKSLLTNLVSTMLGASGATVAGKTVVSNILKLIPGAGTIAGGAISGATASMLTTALGEAYIGVMTAMFKGELKESDLKTKEGEDKLRRIFTEQMKKKTFH